MATKKSGTSELLVHQYISAAAEEPAEMLRNLRSIILDSDPRITEEVKWGNPCYSYLGIMIHLRAFKNHTTLGFFRGNEIPDPAGRLEGQENPVIRSIRYKSINEIDADEVRDFVARAMKVNERKLKK